MLLRIPYGVLGTALCNRVLGTGFCNRVLGTGFCNRLYVYFCEPVVGARRLKCDN